MKQPEGFATKGKEHLVCKLKKNIYSLKQSPRCWNVALDPICVTSDSLNLLVIHTSTHQKEDRYF